MKEEKSKPVEKLRELADKHTDERLLSSVMPRDKERFNQYAAEQVGKVVLKQRSGIWGNSVLKDLKSDDLKDQGLRRLEKPIKRKRSSVYKLSK